MKFIGHRTDGKTAEYVQDDPRRIATLMRQLSARGIFSGGPIVIGVHSPFNVVRASSIEWIAIDTDLPFAPTYPSGIESVTRIETRAEYENTLAAKWPLWNKHRRSAIYGDPLEVLAELCMASGAEIYLHIIGTVSDADLVDLVFGAPVIQARAQPHGACIINPQCINRSRIYHSKAAVRYPPGTWLAEPADI